MPIEDTLQDIKSRLGSEVITVTVQPDPQTPEHQAKSTRNSTTVAADLRRRDGVHASWCTHMRDKVHKSRDTSRHHKFPAPCSCRMYRRRQRGLIRSAQKHAEQVDTLDSGGYVVVGHFKPPARFSE